MADVLVTGIKIGDMPLKGTVSGNEKLPTGDVGDLAVTPSQIKDFTIAEGNLVNQEQLDDAVESLEQTSSGIAGRVQTLENRTSNVNNTADLDKPISNATQAALNEKADKSYVDSNLDLKADKDKVVSSFNGQTGSVTLNQSDLLSIGEVFATTPNFQDVPKLTQPNGDPIPEIDSQIQPIVNGLTSVRQGISPVFDQIYAATIGGYPINSRLMLSNGDIVKSTINNNTNNPNTNMTGWVKINSASQVVDSSGLSQQTINSMSTSVIHFGAKSNASPSENFDSTQAFKDALDFDWVVYPEATSLAYYPKAKIKRVRVPLGRYLITDTLPLTSYLCLDFDDGVVIDFKPTSKKPLFSPPIDKMIEAYEAGATNWKDMTIYAPQIKGAVLFKGNMTASSTVHATYAIQAANVHRGLFSRFSVEGFEKGLSIERLDTSAWTGGSPIGNFYENVVDNVSLQDCTLPFFNSGNLTTMINCRIGHEVLQTSDLNMGDYLMMNYGAGFTSFNLNIASVWRGANPKKGHIFEACAGSTYHGLYSEYFDNLFVLEPITRFGGLSYDPSHIVKYPTDVVVKFIEGYMPSYDPITGQRGGKNLKTSSNFVELFTCGIRIMNSNAELIEDFFEFAPQYDFKYGMYGTEWYWSKNIAVDFKRWEAKSTGFLSPYGARFIATQDTEIAIKTKNQQYDANICILMRDIVGNYSAGDIKLNVQGSNEFITVAEVVYDYGNGWKMYSLRNAQMDPNVETYLRIVIPQGCQIEIEHIGAYKGGVPLYPTFKDYKPKVNSDNYMFTGSNDVEGGTYQYRFSGGQFGLGDELAPFIPSLPDGSIVTNVAPIQSQYVSVAGSNRQTIKDGNHTAYYGDANIVFSNANTFDSSVLTVGNSRNFSESIGIGQYIGITQSGTTTNDVQVVGRTYDIASGKYSTNLVLNKNFTVGSAVANHGNARKPVFSKIGVLTGSKDFDPPSLAANEITSTTISVSGATVGNRVDVGFSVPLSGSSMMWGEVSSVNTVTVYHRNLTNSTLDVGLGTLVVEVSQ